jgi:hypothetical protein
VEVPAPVLPVVPLLPPEMLPEVPDVPVPLEAWAVEPEAVELARPVVPPELLLPPELAVPLLLAPVVEISATDRSQQPADGAPNPAQRSGATHPKDDLLMPE